MLMAFEIGVKASYDLSIFVSIKITVPFKLFRTDRSLKKLAF